MTESESRAAFARRHGLTRPRITQLVGEGLPTNPDKTIPIADGIAWMRANRSPARSEAGKRVGGRRRKVADTPPADTPPELADTSEADDGDTPPPADAPEDYWAAKTRRERALAGRAELILARERGALLPADEVRRTVHALAKAERDGWTAWPMRVAPVLAAELGADVGAVSRALDRLVREHLAELAEVTL